MEKKKKKHTTQQKQAEVIQGIIYVENHMQKSVNSFAVAMCGERSCAALINCNPWGKTLLYIIDNAELGVMTQMVKSIDGMI